MAAAACIAAAQWPASAQRLDWRRIGNTSVDLMLAAPATGPVTAVWFSPDGARLYARSATGRTLFTGDFDTWTEIEAEAPAGLARSTVGGEFLYRLESDVLRSDDAGRSWLNLTAHGEESIIGREQRSIAIAPRNPEHVVVANDRGVWRSLDGGLSWTGLNRNLPNLPVWKILAPPAQGEGIRLVVDGIGPVEAWPGGSREWRPTRDAGWEREIAQLIAFSSALGATVTAAAGSGDFYYAGDTSGRLWTSTDRGGAWRLSRPLPPAAEPRAVTALYVDRQQPRVALATLGGRGARVLRTVNGGQFWDDLTANLPEGQVRGITADRTAGAVYVATEQGIYLTRVDLDAAGPPAEWRLLSEGLPSLAAVDVKLGSEGNQLYAALEGYGVYATAAPHRATTLRLVNAADFSSRPAAPGSVVSVLGGRVNLAQAGMLNFPVLASSDEESQIQVPFETPMRSVSLALQLPERTVTIGLPVEAVSPAIFVDREGVPMLLDADTGVLLDAATGARSGSRVQILATGLGKVRPEWPTGLAAPLDRPPEVTASVRAYLDRTPVEVTRATLAPGYIGFYLVEVQLPVLVNAGPAEIYLAADGQESNRVRIYLEP
ncbi:MAG: hypothetical protein WD696_00455 [Bryobacteraceae bacterium]